MHETLLAANRGYQLFLQLGGFLKNYGHEDSIRNYLGFNQTPMSESLVILTFMGSKVGSQVSKLALGISLT